MSWKRKSTSALEGDEGEDEESLAKKLLRRMESKGDVTFLAGSEGEQEEIKASSFLLSTLSPVFDVMFNENWKQQNQKVIELPDIKPNIFRHFLKLLASEKVSVEDFNVVELSAGDVLHMLYVAKKYGAESILSICRVWIDENMTVQNVLPIFFNLQKVDETELEKQVFEFMIASIEELMKEASFLDLSEGNLKAMLQHDGLSIKELTLFKGVYRWAESKCASKNVEINGENIRAALGSVLFLIRFPVMTNLDFFKSVQPTGILSLEEINEIARCIAMRGDPSFVSKSRFSSTGRGKDGNTNESFVATVPQPALESCHVFEPTGEMALNGVVVNSASCYGSSYSADIYDYSRSPAHQWSLKLRIFDGEDGELLPMVASNSTSAQSLSYSFAKPLNLEGGKSYYVHYEVKRNGSTPFVLVSVSDYTIQINAIPSSS